MIMRGNEFYCYLYAIAVIAFLSSCGINNFETPVAVAPTTETASIKATQTMGIQTANQTLNNPTGTMEPVFSYWATAQQARFNSEYTQVAETKQAIFSLATTYPQMCGFENEGVSVSPDTNWIAMDCRYAGDFFRVFQIHGNRVWDIPYSKIFPYYPEFAGSVRALHWSEDSKHLYFANRSCCADIDAMTNGDILYKLNLQNGKWISFILGNFNYYSFSPDGQLLIYLLNNQAGINKSIQLHLLNLATEKEQLINAGNFEMAWIVWKQDGKQLALIAQTGNIYEDNRKFALVVADLQTMIARTIVPLGKDGLGLSVWSDDDVLTVRKSQVMEYNDYYVNSFDTVYYDLKTYQFVTPTIIP